MQLCWIWRSAILLAAACSAALYGQDGNVMHSRRMPVGRECPEKARRETFGMNDSGDVVNGPVCVAIEFNALHYSAELGRTITFTAGPNLATTIGTSPNVGGAEPPASASAADLVKRYAAL